MSCCASPSSAPGRPGSTPPAICSTSDAVEVDMIERLPTPWGLVRLGVAPDHPKIKAVSKAFEKIAAQPGFRFLGNVEVGRDLTAEDLSRLYDAVVYAVGAQTDRRMGIPGEDLPGLLARHRVRRLVQRPPRLPGALVRPLRRARGCGRGRQRRDRRRADARARARGDPADRHDRRGDRRDPRLRLEGDRPAGPPWPGPGGIHDARAEGARRAGRRRRDRRPRRPRARPCERGLARDGHERAAERRGASRVRRPPAGRAAEGDPSAVLRLARCDPGRGPRRGDRSRTQPPRRRRGRPYLARSRPTNTRRSRAGSSSGASAIRGSSCRESRSRAAGSRTSAAGSAAACTARAGSSAARAA